MSDTPSTKEAMETESAGIFPLEGLHVLHSFYQVNAGWLSELSNERRSALREDFIRAIHSIQSQPQMQLIVFSTIGSKADWGFLLTGPELHELDAAAKQLSYQAAPGAFDSVFSWYSLTEKSEYTTTEEEYAATLMTEEGIAKDTPAYEEKLTAFRLRMAKYEKDRLFPRLPDWPVVCFYPMSKRRAPEQNWYALPFAERKELMKGHAKVGRTYSGRILQLITGATGLDDMEWGVTLLAKTPSAIKEIVYEMRFDPVSAHYADFGEFYIGVTLSAEDLAERLGL